MAVLSIRTNNPSSVTFDAFFLSVKDLETFFSGLGAQELKKDFDAQVARMEEDKGNALLLRSFVVWGDFVLKNFLSRMERKGVMQNGTAHKKSR